MDSLIPPPGGRGQQGPRVVTGLTALSGCLKQMKPYFLFNLEEPCSVSTDLGFGITVYVQRTEVTELGHPGDHI